MRRLLAEKVGTALVVLALVAWSSGPAAGRRGDLPERLTDQEFWRLSEDLSEPNGYFRSDNLLSNEQVFARILPELVTRAKPGGVYLGVGPEQNFTYITAIKPKMAFIIDIRRGNLHLQLMYKALFELSADRAEFLSRLFTKPRPEGLTAQSTVRDLFAAYEVAPTASEEVYKENLRALEDVLMKKHALPLAAEDVSGIAYVYRAFFTHGPAITWSTNIGGTSRGGRSVTYSTLMIQSDLEGKGLSYLASEENYLLLKDLESRNMIVPVVGDFGGPKAIRAIGSYLRDRGAIVTAFYLSNVEQYLRQDGKSTAFCRNSAALPLDEASVFIRPSGGAVTFGRPAPPIGPAGTTINTVYFETARRTVLYPIADEVKGCGAPAPEPPIH
ncbi:MAG TPA: hypothetical protein VES67_12370 [Vicinamibacterales bacterium]|nr:hypothetical protein [Vicinamibacterales bacterium]